MLTIINNGEVIKETNFWDTEQASKGFYHVSWNAGVARVLVPDSQIAALDEMLSAQYVIVSRGPWISQGNRQSLELLFEDNSDAPFSIIVGAEQTDRLLPETEQGSGFTVAVWSRHGEAMRFPAKFRIVEKIPCLEEWRVQ